MSETGFRPKRPTRAVVLAAGRGTRMGRFSRDLPKPLLPFWNRPIIRRTLETLGAWGVTRALVNLHHGAADLLDELRSRPVPGLALDFSFEPRILGTGGALRRAAWFPAREPFWIVNADIAFDLDPDPMCSALRSPRTLAALWLHPSAGPRTVRMVSGRITGFRSGRPGRGDSYTFCGLHLVRPDLLRYLPVGERFAGIIGAYERALRAGRRIAGVCVAGSTWADLGTPERLLAAHAGPGQAAFAAAETRRLRRAGVRVRGWAAADPSAVIGRGAALEGSVVCAGARIRANVLVRNALIGRDAEVRGPASGGVLSFARISDSAERAAAVRAGLRLRGMTAQVFPERGSAREFVRVEDGRRRAMLIRYGPERPENARYAEHARALARCGVPVPRLLFDDPEARLLILEDLGDRSLQAVWPGLSDTARFRLFRRILPQVARFHRAAGAIRRMGVCLEPAFGPAVYRYERELFLVRYVADRAGCPRAVPGLRAELESVSARLARGPCVLTHRDLQSSNILLPPRGPVFIDFQGMRMGPPAYDWASLVFDPYLPMDGRFRIRLLGEIVKIRGAPGPAFRAAAVQRLTQALGAYARLAEGSGGKRFEAAIPRALAHLRLVLRTLDPPLPRLLDFVRKQEEKESGCC